MDLTNLSQLVNKFNIHYSPKRRPDIPSIERVLARGTKRRLKRRGSVKAPAIHIVSVSSTKKKIKELDNAFHRCASEVNEYKIRQKMLFWEDYLEKIS